LQICNFISCRNYVAQNTRSLIIISRINTALKVTLNETRHMTQGPPNSQSASLFQLPFFHFPLLPCLSSPFPFPSSHFYFPSPPLKISQRSWVTASRSCILMHLFAAFISVFAPQSKHQRRSQWQVNSYAIIRVRNCAPPPKVCGPVRPTANTPKAGPESTFHLYLLQ